MSTIRLTLFAAALAVCTLASAQSFLTSFEAPTYTVGQSALGVYGWQGPAGGYLGGTAQTVTDAHASDGSQSLLFNDAADANSNVLREAAYLGGSGTSTFSTDVWLGANNGAGRVGELRFTTGSDKDEVISIDGSGTIRAGTATYSYPAAYPYGGNTAVNTAFASPGTYAFRWLHMAMTRVSASGLTTATISGFGDLSSYSFTFTGNSGAGQLELCSTVNSTAANQTGQVLFDNVGGPAPVPEPTTLAALGLGAVGVAARRRRR